MFSSPEGKIMAGNGHDYNKAVFNDEGTGGTFEDAGFTYAFPDAAAETSGTYQDKAWFQNWGMRGTFTYDPSTFTSSSRITDVYVLNGAGLDPYEANYSWRDVKFDVIGLHADPGDTATWTGEVNLVYMPDSVTPAYVRTSPESTEWKFHQDFTEVFVESGTPTTRTELKGSTFTLEENTLIWERTIDTTETGKPDEHEINTKEYTVLHFFPEGESSDTITFADAWKAGNTVTFELEQERQTIIEYTGSTPPSPPTVDPGTGEGGSYDGDPTTPEYYIDERSGNTVMLTFAHYGEFIVAEWNHAYRGM
jgi:hypothetical protein